MLSPQYSRGFAASLALIRWDVFATLTFKNPLPIERRAWRLAWRHLHEVAQSLGVPYSTLLIALRSERGELGDRFHFHYLLGHTGAGGNPYSFAFQLAHRWKVLTSGAHAEIRPYDPELAGSDYIEKCLSGGNLYEVGKFNRADRLELSRSVFLTVSKGLRGRNDHSADQDRAKNTGFPVRGTADGPAVRIGRAVNALPSPA